KNRLIGEIVCALLGRATGLRVPKPFLVRVNRADLPQSTKWDASEKARLCFGSEDAKVLSLKRRVNVTNAAQMRSIAIWWNQLRESAAFKRMALFDEWVANHDRNLGNILWDGEPWLIDHANALTGPDWKLADLQPDTMKFTNVLLSDSYVNTLRQDVKHRWKDEATQERVKYVDIAVDTLAENG